MASTRVEIDLNDVDADGLTTALLRDASAPLAVGDEVVAFEPEDYVEAPATVVKVNAEHGLVYLRVGWAQMVKSVAAPVYDGLQVTVARAPGAIASGWPSANRGLLPSYV